MHPLFRVLLAATLTGSALAASAGDVQVAVAANFALPLERIGAGFATVSGHTLKVSVGSTGKFHSQIEAGAPFEVLIAADDETPKKLVAAGHAVAGSAFTYAIGRLVLWSAQPGFVDDQGAVLGVLQSAGAFARVCGPATGGLLYQGVGHAAPYVAASLGMVVAGALSLRLGGPARAA